MNFDYLIIAGGKKVRRSFLAKCLKASQKIVIIDRGAAQIPKIKADLFVGDGDSFKQKPNAKKIIWLNQNKNLSDLEFALMHLPEKASKLVISSHLDHENRVDHALVNLLLPLKYKNVYLGDEKNLIMGIKNKLQMRFKKKTLFSLVSPNGAKLTVKGASFNVKDQKIKQISHGLSNIAFAQKTVTITTNKPSLLIANTDFSQVI